MTTPGTTSARPATGSAVHTAVTAAALIGAVTSAAYVAGLVLLSGMSPAQAQRAPVTVVESLLAGAAFVAVAVTLPGLAQTTRLPRWALTLAAVGCAFIGAQAWTYGSLIANVATVLTEEQFTAAGEPTLLLELFLMPTRLACVVGFTSLAVVGWRRRAISRGACVLLVLAALVALPGPFPPVGLLGGLALAWAARSSTPAAQTGCPERESAAQSPA